jgi:hypothetical protein
MYYTIISKTPLINKNLSNDDKMLRTLIVGSICYVITHAILFSPKFSNQLIEKYRNYIYYVWGVDLSMAFVMIKFFGKNNEIIDLNINSYIESEQNNDNEESEDNGNFQLQTNGDKLTREEIMERFYKENNLNKEIVGSKSPFIKSKEIKEQKETKDIKEKKTENKSEENNQQYEQPKINQINQVNQPIQHLNKTNEIHVSTEEEKISQDSISDTEIKTYKGKNNLNINVSLSA